MTIAQMAYFSNKEWLRENAFTALHDISRLLNDNPNKGREALIRVLEHRSELPTYDAIITSLIQKSGLYPYIYDTQNLSSSDLMGLEFHSVEGLEEIVLHSVQGKVYRALCDGQNVILSAPTSFGKSLLIDAMIASRRFDSIVVIVPTIALIDETRRRLTKRFSPEFKIITHPSQEPSAKNIYVLTQERFVEFEETLHPQFFVLDEFYKLSPIGEDERTFVLNHAFYKLLKSGAQFFLIGPNVQDITIKEGELSFRYFRTDFSTVATEVTFFRDQNQEDNVIELCKTIEEPTLIFCKSAASAYKLAATLRSSGIRAPSVQASEMASWLRGNYHPEWDLADLLDDGFAIHHGALPRSVAYHLLKRFNQKGIRYLLCTSTIIEGVNTAAKNIIIFDNKIATTKFDQFTFNNIKGRAGRMFEHFVGHVYVLNPEPQPELPLVDIPSITQPDSAPESLLIQMEEQDLSEQSLERIRYLHAQDILPIEVMRSNSGILPSLQLSLAEEIAGQVSLYHPQLSWRGYPTNQQLKTVCDLMFKHLMDGHGKDGIFTAKQLYFKISQFKSIKEIPRLIEAELQSNRNVKNPSQAVESVLTFMRRWGEYHFPRYLSSLDKIQRSVFQRAGLVTGNYEPFAAEIKQLFMPLSATVLEEYGLPYQATLKIENRFPLGQKVDEILLNVRDVDADTADLTAFEQEMLTDVVENL